jgi:hypothetical protein
MPLTKEKILARLLRREHSESSELFGGELTIRELTRAEFRAIREAAQISSGMLDVDKWNGGLFCAGVLDGKGQPMFTLDELMMLPQRDDLWDEVRRVAELVLNFNEVGAEHLKKKSDISPETPESTPSTDRT